MGKHRRVGRWAKYADPKEPYDRFVLGLLQPQSDDIILDNGTGNGRFASLLESMGCEVFAIDINLTLLAEAADKARRHDKFHVVLADMTYLPFPERMFDKIICVHNLWYVRDYVKAVHEMLRAARPRGIVVIDHLNLFNMEDLHHIDFYIAIVRGLMGLRTIDVGRSIRALLRPFPTGRTSVFSILSYKPLQVVNAPKFFALRYVVKAYP